MSVEDLDADFLSDESDYETKKNLSESENEDGNEVNYQELVNLHNELKFFDHIYANNIMMDTEYEEEAWADFDSDSLGSELALILDHIDSVFEDVQSAYSSVPHSITSPEDESSSDTEGSVPSSIQDFAHEEVVSTSSSYLSASPEGPDEQLANDNTNTLQDEVAESPL